MKFDLPKLGKPAIPVPHFPTRHQAFIFRAKEYVSNAKIASLLKTSEQNIIIAASDMGLDTADADPRWLTMGYITIIKQMWHLLPYDQLLELIEMDDATFAMVLREEDFLDYKLKDKPVCEPIAWRELTEDEKKRTAEIKAIMQTIDISGVKAFDFTYDVPTLNFKGREHFKTRYIYAHAGLYLHAFDVDSRSYCPDDTLKAYQKLGINGLWTQAVLYQLTEFSLEPSISKGYEKRLEYLKDFVARCKNYGIKIYLYINEPRSMPNSFYEKYPHLKGHTAEDGKTCLCVSTKEVQDYLTNNIEWLCRQVPDLGGFFLITRSENKTNCYSHSMPDTCNCPRCSQKSMGEVIGTVVSCVEKGAHRVSPDIKVLAWDWAWGDRSSNSDIAVDIINHMPDNITLLCKSEQDNEFTFGGVTAKISDYSITKLEPGNTAKRNWAAARKRGLKLGAKVQINTSWECSTVPAVPLYPNIEKHMKKLRDEGVEDIMLSWTLGGYPSTCLAYAAKYFYDECDLPEQSENEKRACEILCDALYEFPSEMHFQYNGPHNGGPSNPLYLEPTGYVSTMTCFTYDDIDGWRRKYPREVIREQFEKICTGVEKALDIIKDEPENETVIMIKATYFTYKACLNQTEFIMARDRNDRDTMKKAAESEIEVARGMLELMNKNASIGFEAANHYYYSKGQLAEKIINCQHIIDNL